MDNSLKKNIENIQEGAAKKGSYNFKDVHVHTMPKGYKKSPGQSANQTENAKKTGFIILVFGSLFLLLILVTSYYYFVVKPSEEKRLEIVEETGLKMLETNTVPEKKTAETKRTEEAPLVEEEPFKEELTASEKEEPMVKESEQNNDTDFSENIVEEIPPLIDTPSSFKVDMDNDGLSQEEEFAVGTSDNLEDTDNDSYSDLSELLNAYNPTGEGDLSQNLSFKKFENSKYNFSFYYPVSFLITASTDDTIIFDLGDKEYFQIFVEDNNKKLSIDNWYKNQYGVNIINENQRFVNGEWEAIKNEDTNSIFFKNDSNDYVIAFNYSSADGVKYASIFEVVFNSFKSMD